MGKTIDFHQTVLLPEAIEALGLRRDGRYLDATFGRGGHSGAILQSLGDHGALLALDRDPTAEAAAVRFSGDPRFTFRKQAFSTLSAAVNAEGWDGVDGILMDLGVSSPQLDNPERGFSFQFDGPLDMRMDPDSGLSVADWLADAELEDIANVLWQFGEERFSRRIARAIVEARQLQPLTRTGQLAALVADAVPTREPGKHPATRTFQALRIFINGELGELDRALVAAVNTLVHGGRLVVISFHSLEDRRVKRFMRDQARADTLPLDLPAAYVPRHGRLKLLGRAIRPSEAEVAANPRARSAVMRIAERYVA